MSVGDWIGKRVHNWTTKPFPEGIPSGNGKNDASSARAKSTTVFSSPVSKNTSSASSLPAEQPAMSEAPKESPEEIAEKIMILIPYIKQYRSQGMLDEEIEAFLKEHNWPEYIVKKAIQRA